MRERHSCSPSCTSQRIFTLSLFFIVSRGSYFSRWKRKISQFFPANPLNTKSQKCYEYKKSLYEQENCPTHLGDVIDPRVKTTSGGLDFGVVAFPNKMTVSPLKTFFTRAIPLVGRTVARGTTGAAGTAVVIFFIKKFMKEICM